MKSSILILAITGTVILGSCSVYRSGQTPDDLYYAPEREVVNAGNRGGYVQAESGRSDGRRYYSNSRSYSAYDDFATMDDRWLMMRVRNPYRWSMFDNYTYFNSFSPFAFGGMGMYSPMGFYNPHSSFGWGGYNTGWNFGLGFGSFHPWGGVGGFYSPYNSYLGWNSFYNPYYYHGGVVASPKLSPAGYSRARTFNVNNYNNFNNNTRASSPSSRPVYNNTNRLRYNNSNNSTINGANRRPANSNDYYRTPSNNNRPSRTYNPSSNNSSYSPSISPSSGGSRGGGNFGGGGSSGGGAGGRPSRR